MPHAFDKHEPPKPPQIRRDIVVITGGYLHGNQVWRAPIVVTDGVEFLKLSKADRGLAAFLGFDLQDQWPLRDCSYFNVMADARDRCTDDLHDAYLRSLDPMADTRESPSKKLKTTRIANFDMIPKIANAYLKSDPGDTDTTGVKLMTSARKNECVHIELTSANLSLLLKACACEWPEIKPKRGDQERSMKVDISMPNVRWNSRTESCYCRYFCSLKSKWRTKSMKVKCVDDDPIRYREAVEIVSNRVQQFYESNHYDDEYQEQGSERGSEHESANAEECGEDGRDSGDDASPDLEEAFANPVAGLGVDL